MPAAKAAGASSTRAHRKSPRRKTEATEQAPAASGPASTGKSIWLWPLLLLMLAAFGLVA